MTEKTHPLTAQLLELLPPRGDLADLAIVAPAAAAAAAQRESVLSQGRALCGAHFVTAAGLARLVLDQVGRPAAQGQPDRLELRERLRHCIADRRDPAARYASRFPGALRELLDAIVEWWGAGCPEPSANAGLSAWASATLEIARTLEARTGDLATRRRSVD